MHAISTYVTSKNTLMKNLVINWMLLRDAFAQIVAEDVIKQTIALFDYDESMSSTSESIANYVALGRIRAHFKVGDML